MYETLDTIGADLAPDIVLKSLIDMLPKVKELDIRANVKEAIALRRSVIQVGLLTAKEAHPDVIRDLEQLDPTLRLRKGYDGEEAGKWVVDKFVQYGSNAWVPIFAVEGDLTNLVSYLKEHDMQRFSSPAEYLRHKRAKADKIKQDNKKRADDEMREAIDLLPRRSVKQFLEVERALATGEKIIPGGDDAVRLNKIYEETKKHPPIKCTPLNPGHDPRVRLKK
jgi:hypothetical protein